MMDTGWENPSEQVDKTRSQSGCKCHVSLIYDARSWAYRAYGGTRVTIGGRC